MRRTTCLYLLVLTAISWALIGCLGVAEAATGISFTGVNGGFVDGVPRVIGWEFTTGSQPLSVTQLGVYDHNQDGLLTSHSVAIYDFQTTNAVVTSTVPSGTAATLTGLSRYVSVSSTLLNANKEYIIAASWPEGADQFVWTPGIASPVADIVGLSVSPAITLGLTLSGLPAMARFEDTTSTLQFPHKRIGDVFAGDPRTMFVGPNFTFSIVPEPASIVLFGLGAVGLFCVARRRKKSGKTIVACFLLSVVLHCSSAKGASVPAASFTSGPTTVGHTGQNGNSSHTLGWTFSTNSNLLVTSFGYYDDGGDGLLESHNVGIFDSSGTLLSSTLVPSGLSATLVAKFRYEPVTPFLLAAGNMYTIGGTIGADASDSVAYDVAGLASIPGIAIPSGASRYTESGSYTDLNFPTSSYPPGNPYNAYFGPNFEAQSVPEPASIVLVSLGLLSLLTCFRSRVQ